MCKSKYMSIFYYKLEYNKQSGKSDDSVYVHTKIDPIPYYRFQIGKEDYLSGTNQDAFANGLFSIGGITEISVTAFRIWYMKSPIYDWQDVNTMALNFMQHFVGATVQMPIVGSANINGNGIRLDSETQRRKT